MVVLDAKHVTPKTTIVSVNTEHRFDEFKERHSNNSLSLANLHNISLFPHDSVHLSNIL